MVNIYDAIYVIGHGSTPLACAQLISSLGLQCKFYETSGFMPFFSQKPAQIANLLYGPLTHEQLPDIIKNESRVLIISANNMMIFPQWFVEKSNVRIINYHNSLLPAHRGVRAEAWAIYSGEPYTGITWHYVDKGIDTGPIICQKKLEIGEKTSIALLKAQSALAISALSEFIDDLLTGKCAASLQSKTSENPPHKMADRPNDGILDESWAEERIWNFLRAFDYGVLNILGQPKIKINDIWCSWQSYVLLPSGEKTYSINKNDYILGDTRIVLKNIFPVNL